MTPILIAGAGPAGSSAALAALGEGAAVRLYEKSHFPRHKVCGEFLSPEIQPALESLGVWNDFLRAGPCSIRSVQLHFGRREKAWRLPAPAFGLSRYRFDQLLASAAVSRGADLVCGTLHPAVGETTVVAHGRKAAAQKGSRLFGFKAHFTGPASEVVELFFQSGAYAGVSSVENGITNVCALAPESRLAAHGFDIDRLVQSWGPLRDRLAGLSRTMDWLITGPLLFGRARHANSANHYPAGDALGFIDPFTGSGILSAVLTGRLAGSAAARNLPSTDYLRQCERLLRSQYRVSSLVRFAILSGLAESLARWLPGELLFSLTRPQVALK
jgi:menaquinone-9 beta-reductase